MAQAAFYDLDDLYWRSDAGQTKVHILSSESFEEQEYLPQVRVQIGDLADYNGSIDHLKEWAIQMQTYLFADQAYVAFSCKSAVEQEAADMAERLRQILFASRGDLGKMGIFGVQNPVIQRSRSAREGTASDHLYEAVLQAAFMIISKETREPDDSNPLYEGGESISNYKTRTAVAGDPIRFPETDPELSNDPSPVGLEKIYLSGGKIYLEFSGKLSTPEPFGFTVTHRGVSVVWPIVRDVRNFKRLILEPEAEVSEGKQVTLTYAPGDLRDDAYRLIQSFGPVTPL